jgi:hypothetical protein
MEKYKDIRAALKKEGKIVGFHHNNIHIGLKKSARNAVHVEKDADSLVKLYLAKRFESDTDYVVLETAAPTWFSDPYELSVPAGATLLDFIKDYVPDDGNSHGTAAESYVTNVITTGSWLEGFKFHDSVAPLYYSQAEYSEPYEKEDGHWYMTYEGKDWMYFCGSPSAPVDFVPWPDDPFIEPDPHPSPYPPLTLDQFLASRLAGDGYGNQFTLSYEEMWIEFQVSSGTVDGEPVHTLIKKEVKHKRKGK